MHEKPDRLALLALTALLPLGCATAGGEGLAVGASAFMVAVIGFDGRTYDRRALAGQVVLLDLWASWCGPCKKELPLLDAMAARLRAKKVTVLAVSLDENQKDAVDFLKSRGVRWSLSL